jgi:hypothetical protein
MLRYVIGGLVCVVLVGGVALGQQPDKKPRARGTMGTFVSFEENKLTLIVGGRRGTEGKEQKFEIGEDVKVWIYEGDGKEKPKESKKRDALKDVKEKTRVVIRMNEEKKITDILVNFRMGGRKAKPNP